LCLRDQLWGKARSYLDDSLRTQAHPATLLALGRLDEAVGDEAKAAEHYRQAALGFANLMADAAPWLNAAGRPLRREQLL
jgi:HemY protein